MKQIVAAESLRDTAFGENSSDINIHGASCTIVIGCCASQKIHECELGCG